MTGVLAPDYWIGRARLYESVADGSRLDLMAGLAAMHFRRVAAVLRKPVTSPSRALQSAGVLADQARCESDPEVAAVLRGAAEALADLAQTWVLPESQAPSRSSLAEKVRSP